ncbi:MAG: ABC transporter ATP-binding protein [Phascolarctobacterium sp.]
MSGKIQSSGLVARGISLSYGSRTIIDGLELELTKPEIVSIIGPNGSGKSTLLKALCRLLEPSGGTVYLDGKNINTMTAEAVAKAVAVMAQSATAPGGTTVQELVTLGRMPHRHFLAGLSAADKEAVEAAIAFTELEPLRQRLVHTLSGGERQRAWLAMALAQEPQILLLDEPTTYLDVHHQLELMELVVRLQRERQMLIIMVLHDLNHAARFSNRLIALKKGHIMADGPTKEVFVEPIIEELYDVKAVIMKVEALGGSYPVCLPYRVTEP